MKTYISILLLLAGFTTQAQEIIVPLKDKLNFNEEHANYPVYYKDVDNTLDKFTGNWIFDDGTHYLKISVTKKVHQDKSFFGRILDPNFEDKLSITLIYKLNGTEIYNTTSSSSSQGSHITGNLIKNNLVIQLFFSEPTSSCRRSKRADLILEFIPEGLLSTGSNPNGELKWTRKNRLSGISPLTTCSDGTLVDSSDFIIPPNLILERE